MQRQRHQGRQALRALPGQRPDHARHRGRLAAFTARALVTGLVGSVASAVAALVCSRAENGRATPPINAVSHIYDGTEPPTAENGRGYRNTLLGSAIHTCGALFWAVFYEAALRRRDGALPAAAAAAATAAVAYHVDYNVVHRRFRPGFEAHLSRRGLFTVYAALAAGFAAAAVRRKPRLRRQ